MATLSLAVIFGILGNIISLMVYLAPLPTFHRIYKKKATEGFGSLPYLMALLSSTLWLYYALLKRHDAVLLISINSFGCVIELIYIVIFITYAHKDSRNLTIKIFVAMNMGGLAVALCVSNFALHGPRRLKVLGWICVSVSVFVFASPLSIMAQVCKTKSVQFMPINLSFFLTFSAIMWFAYGLLIHDLCVAIPNVVGFILGILQMVLYCIYRNGEKGVTEQALEAVRVVNPSEVFPIPEDDNSNGLQDHQDKTLDCPV
ncbi:bidirectional sugar transporter N3 [Cajanus cajan]|nr:bidirectional sugar transporter N3 [Cajanus cajan]